MNKVIFERPSPHHPVWLIYSAGRRVGKIRQYGRHGYLARCEGYDIGGGGSRKFLRHFPTLAAAKAALRTALARH
jgi:hypothetical protein